MNYQEALRILIVDDQAAIHDDYRKVIGRRQPTASRLDAMATDLLGSASRADGFEGFELDSAFQGQEALDRVQTALREGRPYALAFVDIRMPPGWDGVETVQRIWEADPDILIVLCSAYSDCAWDKMAEKLGRTDRFLVLKKPFDNIEIRQCAMALTERWRVARTDALTQLLSRNAFFERLERRWSLPPEERGPLSCLMLDVDYFKRINDSYGHLAGDEVLKTVARVVKANCPPCAAVCRFGGEEIAVLLPDMAEEAAEHVGEQIRAAIEREVISYAEHSIRSTVSIGVAACAQTCGAAAELVDQADQALRIAKQSGRNRVLCFAEVTRRRAVALNHLRSRCHPFQAFQAWQVMASPVATLYAHDSLEVAAGFFIQYRISSAPVTDAEGMLVGIVSERDILQATVAEGAWSRPIAELMQCNVVCYEETASVGAIFDFLARVTLRRVVIVRGGKPVGTVSRGSLLRWFHNWLIASGELSQPAADLALDDANGLTRQMAAEALAERANRLVQNLSDPLNDPIPPMIDAVSKIQELANDLLAGSGLRNLCEISSAVGR